MIRRPVLTIIVALLLAAASLLAVRRLRIDTSLVRLFDDDDPAAAALFQVLENFRSVEELLILAESPPDAPPQPDALIAFAQRLDAGIAADAIASQLADGVIYRTDEQTRQFFERVLVPSALFYLDDASFQLARQRLTREEMTRQIRRNEQMIAAPGPAADALAKVILKDPLRLHEFLIDRVGAGRPFKTYQNSGAFLSPDGRALLIRVRGKRPVSDLEFARAFTAAVQRVADRVNTDRLRLDHSGAYAIAAASERAIRSDMISNVVWSVVLLQALFIPAYRRPFVSFPLAFMPVALGTLYGFGAYALLSNVLTPMTAVIGGILAGMSIDYSIEFLSYYHAERAAGANAVDAARSTRRKIGWAVFGAWITSVIGFAAIAWSQVRALRDFAVLGSLGLAGAYLAAMLVLPAVLVLVDRRKASAGARGQERAVPALLHLILGRRRAALVVAGAAFVAAIVVLLLPGPMLPLESDLTVMHPRPNPPLEAQNRIAERLGTSPGSLVIHLSAADDEQLLRLAHNVDRRLREAGVRDAGVVGSFGLAALMPDPAVAPSRLATTGQAVADRVVADFRGAIADSLFDPAAYAPYEQFLRTLLSAPAPPTLADLRRYPSLADNILPTTRPAATTGSNAAITRTRPRSEAITLVFLRESNQQRDARDATVAAVRGRLAELPGATLTGISVLNHDLERAVRRDLPRLIWAAVAAVTVYLVLHFRSVADCLLSMLPAVFGIACFLAFMRLTGQKLNMINLVAFPLLIGIDVDYGIYLVSAGRRKPGAKPPGATTRDALVRQLTPATSAVLLSAVSTTLGFGSLAFTSIPAVRSLGWAVGFGVLACVVATFLISLPLMDLLQSRRRDDAEATA